MSLNPGADATLVAAATKAAMANVPQDLSKQFESLAESYDASMQSIAEAADKIAGKLVPLAANMIKKAIKRQGQRDQYGSNMILRPVEMEREAKEGDEGVISREDFDKDQAFDKKYMSNYFTGTYEDYLKTVPKVKYQVEEEISVHDMLTSIRNEQISLKGKNDPDSKKRRIELKAEKQSVYSELDALDAAETANTELLASGNFDEAATGQKATTMAAAIQAYNSPSGKIIEQGPYEGYHVTLGQNANKEFTFILRNKNGEVITHEDENGDLATGGDTPYSISSNQVGSLLVSKYDEKQYEKLNKIMNDELSKSSVQDYSKINFRNRVISFVNNENSLLGLMNRALGAHPTSFVDEINSSSETSAGYFASLGSVKLEKLGVTDSDGDGVIGDEGDFANAENYKKVKDALLDKSNKNYNWKQTQAAFLDYANEVGRKMHNFTPKGGANTGGNAGKSYNSAAGSWVDFETQDSIISKAKAGQPIWDWKGIKYITDDGGATYTIDNKKLQKKYPQYVNMPTMDLLSGKRFDLSRRIPQDTTFGGGDSGSESDYSIQDLFSESSTFSLSNYRHEDNALKQLQNRLKNIKGLKFKVSDNKVGVDHITATLNNKTYPINLDVPAEKIKETIAGFEAWVKINK